MDSNNNKEISFKELPEERSHQDQRSTKDTDCKSHSNETIKLPTKEETAVDHLSDTLSNASLKDDCTEEEEEEERRWMSHHGIILLGRNSSKIRRAPHLDFLQKYSQSRHPRPPPAKEQQQQQQSCRSSLPVTV